MSQRSVRLMKFFGEGKSLDASRKEQGLSWMSEDGEGGTDTGLGSLGEIPNAPVSVAGRRGTPNVRGVMCPKCNSPMLPSMAECPMCGFAVEEDTKIGTRSVGNIVAERLEQYRERQRGPQPTPIHEQQSSTPPYQWIEEALPVIVDFIQRNHTSVLLESDEISEEELAKRLRNALHGFTNWTIRRTAGLDLD
jgi:hypothetical protein